MDSKRSNTGFDHALVGLIAAAAIPFIVANCAILLHRHRSYFEAQGGVYLIVGSSIAGLACIASTFTNNGHFSRAGTLQHCRLLRFWLPGISFFFWFMFTAFRLRLMYERSHNLRRWRWEYVALAVVCSVPVIAMCIAAFYSDFELDEENNKRRYCKLQRNWGIVRFATYSPYFVFGIIVIYRLQKQRDPLLASEFTDTFDYLALSILILVIHAFAYVNDVSELVSGRCLLTVSQVCLVFLPFWTRFGWPVYLCLFRRKQEMDRFEQQLRDSGARALCSQTGHISASEEAVWEAYSEAEEELAKYMDDIQKLEAQKLLLEESIQQLEKLKAKRI